MHKVARLKKCLLFAFQDLGSKDLVRDAYLVVHVYRIGSLKDENSKKTSASVYRRPYGCAGM